MTAAIRRGVEHDCTDPQATWLACCDLAFGQASLLFVMMTTIVVVLQPDNCGPTYVVIGDGGNEEGVEDDFTSP